MAHQLAYFFGELNRLSPDLTLGGFGLSVSARLVRRLSVDPSTEEVDKLYSKQTPSYVKANMIVLYTRHPSRPSRTTLSYCTSQRPCLRGAAWQTYLP
jgi:hypothetical protein